MPPRLRRLCGVVGLDRLCEDLIAALAAAAGAHTPAPPGSPAEPKQVAALAALVSLGVGPSAALIGSGWVIILRTLSAVDALQVTVREIFNVHSPAPAGSPSCANCLLWTSCKWMWQRFPLMGLYSRGSPISPHQLRLGHCMSAVTPCRCLSSRLYFSLEFCVEGSCYSQEDCA
jgi:hypothetical protein